MTYRLELFKGNGHQHVCTMLKTHKGAHLMVEDLQNINTVLFSTHSTKTSTSSNLLADRPLHKEQMHRKQISTF